MVRILLVGDFPPAPTGYANVNYHIAKLFREEGVDFRIITHLYADKYVEFDGFIARSLKGYRFKELISVLKTHRFDFAVLSSPWFLFKELIPALDYYEIPFIIYTTCEGEVPPEYLMPMIHAEKVYTPSNFSKQFLAEYIPEKKLEVLPHGIDTELFKPNSQPEKIIFSPCRYGDPRKQVDRLIEAFKLIKGDWKLMVSGKPPDVERVIGTWSTDSYIFSQTQTPSIFEMPKLYNMASVVAVIGSEGFSIPIVEAYSCMRPVVALDVPPFNEIIQNRKHLAQTVGSVEKTMQVDIYCETATVKYTLHIPKTDDLAEKLLDAVNISKEEAENLRKTAIEKYNYKLNYKKLLTSIL